MVAWCGPVKTAPGPGGGSPVNYGVFQVFTAQLDNYAFYNYHSFLNPPPAKNASAFLPGAYSNAISLGAAYPGYGVEYSAAGNVTLSYLKAENQEYWADTNNPNTGSSHTYTGPGGSDMCNMRFRHMNNTEANFLFLDGHVEPRALGTVLAQDICVRHAN
jgi:prepilin-type processing-associated H-X9-DG protein